MKWPTATTRATARPSQCRSGVCGESAGALRKKKPSETNEDALKVSLILEGLHLTLYAALMRMIQPLRDAKAEKKV
jgi:hypothetical protein